MIRYLTELAELAVLTILIVCTDLHPVAVLAGYFAYCYAQGVAKARRNEVD